MPHISSAELPEILAIAQAIADKCLQSFPNPFGSIDFAVGASVTSKRITVCPEIGRFCELDKFSASSAIELKIPSFGWNNLKSKKRPAPPEIVSLIASMIAHEIVHERQEKNDPRSYKAVVGHQGLFQPHGGTTPREFYEGYYSSQQEREAHATQAVVALWAQAKLGGNTLFQTMDPLSTEALRRPTERMKPKGIAGDQEIDQWWDNVLELTQTDIHRFSQTESDRIFNRILRACCPCLRFVISKLTK